MQSIQYTMTSKRLIRFHWSSSNENSTIVYWSNWVTRIQYFNVYRGFIGRGFLIELNITYYRKVQWIYWKRFFAVFSKQLLVDIDSNRRWRATQWSEAYNRNDSNRYLINWLLLAPDHVSDFSSNFPAGNMNWHVPGLVPGTWQHRATNIISKLV